MRGKRPDGRRKFPAGPAARMRWAARTAAGVGALAACLLATTAAAPAAVYRPGHASLARHAARAAGAAAVASLWIGIATGGDHTCGIREGNSLWCWGAARYGELGTGATADQDQPQQITKPTAGWASVAAGNYHSCATRNDGTLWCWGYNGDGQAGIGTTTNVARPHQVTTPAGTSWASVTAGDMHTCAVGSDSTLWCWGYNAFGQLGIGTTTNADLPQQVTTPAATGWTSVAAGGGTTCALRTHALQCWGANEQGQLGIGTTTNQDLAQPVRVPTPTGWSRLAVGNSRTCATHTGHTLWCWGDNQHGDLGIGNTTQQNLPQQVTS